MGEAGCPGASIDRRRVNCAGKGNLSCRRSPQCRRRIDYRNVGLCQAQPTKRRNPCHFEVLREARSVGEPDPSEYLGVTGSGKVLYCWHVPHFAKLPPRPAPVRSLS